MSALEAVGRCLKKYADFSGRATVAEFWWWVLLTGISTNALCAAAALMHFNSDSSTFFGIALYGGITFHCLTLIPSLAVTARRLHDLGKSGRWSWLNYAGIYIGPGLSFWSWVLVALLAVDLFRGGSGGALDLLDAIVFLAPLVSVVIAVVLTSLCAPFVALLRRQPQPGPNRFGPDPRAMDTPAPESE